MADMPLWKKETYVSAALSASCCNCMALIFAFLMAVSPFYLWVTGYISAPGSLTRTTLATGSFILSSTSTRVDLVGAIIVNGQTNYWSEMTSAIACASGSDIYTNWSRRYGYCDGPDGTFSIPADVTAVQAFSILTICFLIISICAGLAVEAGGVPALLVSSATSCLAMICAIVSFSVIAANPWNQDLLKGTGGFPLRDATGNWVVISPQMFYGPSFGGSIFVFIVSFFATIMLFQASHWVKKDSNEATDADDFVDEAQGETTGAPETKPGDEGQMYKA